MCSNEYQRVPEVFTGARLMTSSSRNGGQNNNSVRLVVNNKLAFLHKMSPAGIFFFTPLSLTC